MSPHRLKPRPERQPAARRSPAPRPRASPRDPDAAPRPNPSNADASGIGPGPLVVESPSRSAHPSTRASGPQPGSRVLSRHLVQAGLHQLDHGHERRAGQHRHHDGGRPDLTEAGTSAGTSTGRSGSPARRPPDSRNAVTCSPSAASTTTTPPPPRHQHHPDRATLGRLRGGTLGPRVEPHRGWVGLQRAPDSDHLITRSGARAGACRPMSTNSLTAAAGRGHQPHPGPGRRLHDAQAPAIGLRRAGCVEQVGELGPERGPARSGLSSDLPRSSSRSAAARRRGRVPGTRGPPRVTEPRSVPCRFAGGLDRACLSGRTRRPCAASTNGCITCSPAPTARASSRSRMSAASPSSPRSPARARRAQSCRTRFSGTSWSERFPVFGLSWRKPNTYRKEGIGRGPPPQVRRDPEQARGDHDDSLVHGRSDGYGWARRAGQVQRRRVVA